MFAITGALAAGATGIELDVHATADGELVVCHDATVDRTTPASGPIVGFTLAELRRLDFSYWFIPGADVSPGRPEAGHPTTPPSGSPPCARCWTRSPGWC
jgi:glycerophosphoryl diester phosphodiesterase